MIDRRKFFVVVGGAVAATKLNSTAAQTDTSCTPTPVATETATEIATETATAVPTAIPTVTATQSAPAWTDLGVINEIANSPTLSAKQIVQLHPFNGKVFMGYGDWTNTIQAGCDVLAYDPAQKTVINYGHVATDALWSMRTVGDEMWAIVTDPEIGTDPDYGLVKSDNSFKIVKTSNANPWHSFDAVLFKGKKYLCGAARTSESVDTPTVWEYYLQYGTLDQFKVSYKSAGYGRMYALAVLGDAMYAFAASGTIVKTTDGVTWSTIPLRISGTLTKPMLYKGKIVMRRDWPQFGAGAFNIFDGTSVTVPYNVQDHFVENDVLYTLRNGAIYKDDVKVVDAPANSKSLCVLNGTIYVGTADSHLWRF